MTTILVFLLGSLNGLLAGYIYYKLRKPEMSGKFIMDFSDPSKDVCRLVLDENLNDIYKREYMYLEIETHESQPL